MWKYLLLAAFVVIAILVFIRLSSIRYRNRPLIGFLPRIFISLLFPVIGLVIVLLGSIIMIIFVSLVVLFFIILLMLFLFVKPKIYVFKKKF